MTKRSNRREVPEMADALGAAASAAPLVARAVEDRPKELSPSYRGKLVEAILPWSRWALEMHQSGRVDTVPKFREADIHVLRVGDVGIVGMPFEPFLGIGRQIRRRSPLPLAIPCGYTNISYGYLPDGPNTGDREYMSAFYRYTKFRPPYRKPAGDVLVDCAVDALRLFA